MRPPDLRVGFRALEEELPGLTDHAELLTWLVPNAILAGEDLPAGGPTLRRRPHGLRRAAASLARAMSSCGDVRP